MFSRYIDVFYSAQGSIEAGRTSRLMDAYNRHHQQQHQVTIVYPFRILWNFIQTLPGHSISMLELPSNRSKYAILLC